MKKHVSHIMIILFGTALAVVAAVLLFGGQTAWFWVMLVIGILIAAAGAAELRHVSKTGGGDSTKPLPEYRAKQALLSPPEQELFKRLSRICSAEYFLVLPQMALVAAIDKLTQSGYRNELFRIADFCIADAKTTEPLVLIELNDASHRRPDRMERDRKVAEICARAGLPLVTFSMDEARDEAYIRKTLKRHL